MAASQPRTTFPSSLQCEPTHELPYAQNKSKLEGARFRTSHGTAQWGGRFHMKESRSRSTAFALAALMVLAWGVCARADEETKAAPTNAPRSADRPSDDTRTDEPRIGAIAGVGFPRPLAIEALLKLGDFVAVGAEYGILPQTSIAGVDTRLWSLAADGRVFPFRGPFFIGVLAGRQHLGASATLMAQNVGSVSEQLTLDSWFVNPR